MSDHYGIGDQEASRLSTFSVGLRELSNLRYINMSIAPLVTFKAGTCELDVRSVIPKNPELAPIDSKLNGR